MQWIDDEKLTALTREVEGNQNIAKSSVPSFGGNEVPRFATCSIIDCTRPAVRGLSCAICRKHLCAKHQSRRFHTCSSNSELDDEAWQRVINDEVAELVAQINVQELVKQARALNGGKGCKFQTGNHLGEGAIMGCANYHAWILFEDGEKWLVRTPRTGFSDTPIELVEYLVASEYATLKFLESTKVPAPKTFGFSLASDPMNRVGVNYLLMQELSGKPYRSHDATIEQKHRVLGQLADILIELSKYPLQKAGSLLLRDGKIHVSAIASNRFVSLGCYGPFDNAFDYFMNTAEQYLDLIADGQLYYEYPMEAFLFYKILRQHAMDLSVNESPGIFYLKHVDDKGDHLLVDEDYNITGIIDWQFARSVPACEAFGPSLMTADLSALYSSKASITDDDKSLAHELRVRGREDLAKYSNESESVRRFHHGLASGLTRGEVCDMIRGMLATLGAAQTVDIDRWIAGEWIKCQGDHRWSKIEASLEKKQGKEQV
ncbi:hypothetical protein AOQ84DRAFT_305296 [Glonium stellatum]|uniref:Aminoglycoside phosphotransferase domain-containing protein n=1 Tax=Glonium stellatum TaxID=574774 RepID=A0A8E2ENV8_9PEZI|nr:hypothetical protein AOQ84DRAFT_305296 [Glonium stellatum]